MNKSDREYLSRFSLDRDMEYDFEELYGFDFPFDDEMDLFTDRAADSEEMLPEDEYPFSSERKGSRPNKSQPLER